MQVNLLPAEFQNQLIFRNRVRLWIRLWSMFGVLACGICLLSYARLLHIRGSLASLQNQSRCWAEKHQQIRSLDSEISELGTENSNTLNAASSGPLSQWLAKIQQATDPSNTGLQITGLRMTAPSDRLGIDSDRTNDSVQVSPIQMQADVRSPQSLTEFFTQLESQGSFQIRNLQMQEQTDQTTSLTLELSQP